MAFPLPRVALIAGPTASGKSALAMAIAARHDGFIINADSAQVYADLRVLTARPSAIDEAAVPHALFGHVDGADAYSAVRWAAAARAAIGSAHRAGRLPILVGGTGLYLRTLLDGIAPVPAIDPIVRAAVRSKPLADARDMLTALDPEAAARLAPNDDQRIRRALEVVQSTGQTLGSFQLSRAGGIAGSISLLPLILLPPREQLIAQCDARLVAMFANGAVDEVRTLLDRADIAAGAPVRRAIGVAEIARLLNGAITPDAALDQAQLATRRYAKRQATWFRLQPPVAWKRSFATESYIHQHVFESLLQGTG